MMIEKTLKNKSNIVTERKTNSKVTERKTTYFGGSCLIFPQSKGPYV